VTIAELARGLQGAGNIVLVFMIDSLTTVDELRARHLAHLEAAEQHRRAGQDVASRAAECRRVGYRDFEALGNR
jgi:hypothetical protein